MPTEEDTGVMRRRASPKETEEERARGRVERGDRKLLKEEDGPRDGERVPHLAYRESIATHFDRILLEVGECRYVCISRGYYYIFKR